MVVSLMFTGKIHGIFHGIRGRWLYANSLHNFFVSEAKSAKNQVGEVGQPSICWTEIGSRRQSPPKKSGLVDAFDLLHKRVVTVIGEDDLPKGPKKKPKY